MRGDFDHTNFGAFVFRVPVLSVRNRDCSGSGQKHSAGHKQRILF
jgi:hypothetical protein